MEASTAAAQRPSRIRLVEPIAAQFGNRPAQVLEISVSDALIAHQAGVEPGELVRVRFDWQGESFSAVCEVLDREIHRRPQRPGGVPVYRSNVRFHRFDGSSDEVVRQIVVYYVTRAIDEQKANARGIPPMFASSYQRSSRHRGYVTCRLIGGKWVRSETIDPAQPEDGFAVSIDEQSEIDLLCESYEQGSAADRAMIRRMAALSIADEAGNPARRYDP